MLEEIYDYDDQLTEDEFYDALIYLLGDAYPDLSEEELEDLLEDIIDQLPEQYAESVLNTVGTIGKSTLNFAKNNPALVKGGLKVVGAFAGPIGVKVAGAVGNLITQPGQNRPLPEMGKMLALMQNPQAQAAMALGTMGVGNGTAPLLINGSKAQIPAQLYLMTMIEVAQSTLKAMGKNNIIPPASYSESLPFSDDLDMQVEWLVEQLVGNNEAECPLDTLINSETNNCDLFIEDDGYIKGNKMIRKDNSSVISKPTQGTTFKAIVLHRTAGSNIQGAIKSEKGAHFYIGGGEGGNEDGKIFQAVSLKNATSHINNDDDRISQKKIKTYNSIGIEVVGLAYLYKDNNLYKDLKDRELVSKIPNLTKAYNKSNTERYWDILTEKQIESLVCLLKLLMKQYNIEPNMILTHEEIQSKTPGEGQAVKDALCEYLLNKKNEEQQMKELKQMNQQFSQRLLAKPDATKVFRNPPSFNKTNSTK